MILETIAEATRKRVAAEKEKCSLAEMKEKATAMNPDTGFPFEQALKKPGMSFICEVKKASPSKGIIAEDFPYLEIAKEYEAAGASAISCLTEPEYFKGDKRYLKKIAETVSIPVLRKDFTVDPYMIYEAKVLGATAVLLICALLPEETLKEYLETAHSLGLSALVEAHDEAEVAQAMRAGARIIGVNNRNLKDFTVDIHNSAQAAPQSLDASSDDGYALKVKKTDPNAITLAANTTANKNDDQSLGLKIGSKSSIQLYGTIDIGYSKWSQKN